MGETREAGRELDERVAIEVFGWGWMRALTPVVLPPHRWLVPPDELGDWGHVRRADMTEPKEDLWWLRDDAPHCGCVVDWVKSRGWPFRGNAVGHVDHIVPRARGGRTEPANLLLACERCNESKGART
jgi:hypothetical protein